MTGDDDVEEVEERFDRARSRMLREGTWGGGGGGLLVVFDVSLLLVLLVEWGVERGVIGWAWDEPETLYVWA